MYLPRAAPIISPVGPLRPSIQPGYGSFHAAVTAKSVMIILLKISGSIVKITYGRSSYNNWYPIIISAD